MLVQEIMTKNVITIDSEKTVFEACNIYRDSKVGCLIVTKNKECVGIITERDIIEQIICEKKYPELTLVKDIMSTNIKTIHALDDIEKAIELMMKYKIKKLPVKINNDIVGIITVTDISKVKQELDERFIDSWIKVRWRD
jgi:CBS domain-containing protein